MMGRLLVNKPLPEHVLTYCRLVAYEQIQLNLIQHMIISIQENVS